MAQDNRQRDEPRSLNNPRGIEPLPIPNPLKRKSPSGEYEKVDAWAVTEIEEDTFSCVWTIKNFSAVTCELRSKAFKGGQKQHGWQLKVCPKKKTEDKEYLTVHLILATFGDGDTSATRKLRAKFQVSLLDFEGRRGMQAGSGMMPPCEFKRGSVWGYDKFMLAADVRTPTRHLVENDTLRVLCKIWVLGDVKHQVYHNPPNLSSEEMAKRGRDRLTADLAYIFEQAVHSDVEVIVDTTSFMVHKAVLAARSAVFSVMFTTNMREKELNTVVIKDFEEDVVKGMLEYMYVGETEQLPKHPASLLQIADKYDLGGLKEDAECEIAKNLSVRNAAEYLLLAHAHNAARLKSSVMDYINTYKKEVQKTPPFQELMKAHPNLFVDLYLSQ